MLGHRKAAGFHILLHLALLACAHPFFAAAAMGTEGEEDTFYHSPETGGGSMDNVPPEGVPSYGQTPGSSDTFVNIECGVRPFVLPFSDMSLPSALHVREPLTIPNAFSVSVNDTELLTPLGCRPWINTLRLYFTASGEYTIRLTNGDAELAGTVTVTDWSCGDTDVCVVPAYITSVARGMLNSSTKQVVIGANVSHIEEGAFDNCEQLDTLTVDHCNKFYYVEDGQLKSRDVV